MSAAPVTRKRRWVFAVLAVLLLACVAGAVLVGVFAEGRLAPPHVAAIDLTVAGDAATTMDAERALAIPLEAALRRVHGVAHVRLRASPRVVTVRVFPEDSADDASLRAALLAAATAALPDAAVSLSPPVDADRPLRRITAGHGLDAAARHALVARLNDALLRVPGVGAVRICGDAEPEVRVVIDPVRLMAAGVMLDDLRSTVAAAASPPGSVLPGGPQADARPLAERIGSAPIAVHPFHPLVGAVATVEVRMRPSRCRAYRRGSGEIATLDVLGWRANADRAAVAARIDAALAAVTAPPSSLWVFPPSTEHVASGLLLMPASAPDDAWRELTRVADGLAVPGGRELIVQSQSPDPTAPEAAAAIDAVGATAAPPVGDALGEVPGVLFVPEGGRTVHVVGAVDLETLRTTAEAVHASLAGAPNVSAAVLDVGDRPRLDVRPDRATAARYEVSDAELDIAVALATRGELWVGTGRDGDATVDVVLALPDGSLEDRVRLPLAATGVSRVPLSQLAEARMEREPAELVRWDGARSVDVRAWGPADAVDDAIRALARGVRLPVGVRLEAPP